MAGYKGTIEDLLAYVTDAIEGALKVNVVAGGGGGGGAVTVADGADVTQGTTTDAAVITDATGTIHAYSRGLVKLFALVVDQANHLLAARSYDQVDAVYSGSTALTPLYAAIACSSSGSNTIVAAVTAKQIIVLSYVLVANAPVNAKFQSHTIPTDLTGLLYLATNGGIVSGHCPVGHFRTIAGEALDLNLSGNIAVGGHLVYVAV